MAVGELFLSAFLSVLFDRLTSREFLQFALQEGVHSKLKKLERKLKMIEAVLSDAEEKQLTDRAVKLWLDDLRDLAYDVEDILDEFSTEALERKLMAEYHASTSKVRNLIPVCFSSWSPSAVKSNVSLGSKIKGISSRLQELCEQKNELGLEKIAGVTPTAGKWKRTSTTCVPSEPAIDGRDDDRAKILEMVLRNEPCNANFSPITIVGMGGIGKTTLARLVYNDKAVEDFNPRTWVCVTDDFDVLRISKAILESITSSPCNLKDFNQVQVQLNKELTGKKFLLVLDDVWNTHYGLWESLKSPFMAGAPGSKVIVTTRSGEVALTVGPGEYYNLKLLSDDDCWSLFMRHAFDQNKDTGVLGNLELIREKVVEKCKGLPLAAKTLGGLLRCKQRDCEWREILNSKIWDLSDKTEIPAVLKLSYYHLPSHLKRCFAYCAILPKGYEFEEKELVLLWIAEGLVHELKGNRQMEDLGCEYFHNLLLMSFFQLSSNNSSKYIMHDLINDLASWASGETSFRLEDELGGNNQSKSLEKARYSSYTCDRFDGKNKFEVFYKVKLLRTFMPILLNDSPRFISNVVVFNLLSKLKKLRVLSLRRYHIIELPNSIGSLKHLRYLNLSNTMIGSLPESTSSLVNLQILMLRNCSHLKKLPSNLRNLVNLSHLDIRGAKLIEEMPLGMKELKCLHTLSNFILGKGTGSNLKDLKILKLLCGELCISRLENVIDSQETREVILSDKEDLHSLLLEWESQFDDLRNETVEKNVLEILQPHRNLKELTIKCYGGIEFPAWVGDPSFSNIVVLRLEYCEKCTSLPSFGQLVSLKNLRIKGMKGLKSIGSEIYGDSCSMSFQSLVTLCFEDLREWDSWELIEEIEHIERFPRLHELSVVRCPKLSGELPNRLPSLGKLVIRECIQLVISVSSLPMLCELEIDGCKEVVYSAPTDSKLLHSLTLSYISEYGNWLSQGFQNVKHLKIVGCEELVQMWQKDFYLEKPPQRLHGLTSLRKLCIEDCQNLVSFAEACFCSSLSELEIRNCNSLISLPERMKDSDTHLEYLVIEGCNSLAFITRGMLPSSLKNLDVRNCEKLQCLLDDREDTSTSSSSSSVTHKSSTSLLQYLFISQCPSLTCLSSRGQLPEALQHLRIERCPELESIAERLHENVSLGYIFIEDCKNLKSMPEGLQNLNSLDHIFIADCPSLVSLGKEGLPKTNFQTQVRRCQKLEALPGYLHSLKSIQYFEIWDSPLITSFPKEGLPTSLVTLSIAGVSICKPLLEWGLHKLTSLRLLRIGGSADFDPVTFPPEEMGMILPTYLTALTLDHFGNLKKLCSKSFRNFTSLEYLFIFDCPKLIHFPEAGLPSSLLHLYIRHCPLLSKRCKRNEGQEWSKISHIPCIQIDKNYI